MTRRSLRRLLPRVERHALGPRIYVLGLRWHEWHLGLGLLALLALGLVVGVVHGMLLALLVASAAVWLIAKDWRDVSSRYRDTAAWRLGLHRPPLALRSVSRAEPLPALAAATVAAFAVVNLLSASTPNIRWRGHLLLHVEAVPMLHLFHALAIPASIALLVTAYYLARRRRRALRLAVALLVALGLFNLLKGLDFEEAIGDFAAAAVLFAGRRAFYVRHEPMSRRSAVTRVPFVAVGAFAVSFALVSAVSHAGAVANLRETGRLLLWQQGRIAFHDEVSRMDLAIGMIGLAALLIIAYLLFRPLAAPRDLPDGEVRQVAADLVRRHGADTLAYFKLRHDKHYLFGEDRSAFLGYRIQSGVLTVSGEPVGRAGAIPPLLTQLATFAEQRGLRIAALGVSDESRPLFEQIGLRALYMGDEAIIDTRSFSLDGRAIRKVRQSVTRLRKAGYVAELVAFADLDEAGFAALEERSSAWRGGEERGFSMALDAFRRDDQHDTFALLARDAGGEVRGLLHFVPTFGRPAVSLSVMRRDPSSPNGLTEFMVVRAIEEFRERGVEEVSLNFAALARYIHGPTTRLERLAGRLARRADAVFQIERLYRFNAKFAPRWEPRYLMFERVLQLPRVALASLWLEGQLPKSWLRRTPRG